MPTGQIAATASIAGISIQSVTQRVASGQLSHEVTLPKADAGTLTTRTDDTDGELTMADAGHGITTGDQIDIFHDGGVSYGATAGTVAGTTVPFTGAGGAVLPAEDDPITADVQVEVDVDFDGDKAEMVIVMATLRGHVIWIDTGASTLDASQLTATEPWQWIAGQGVTNPLLAGNPVDKVFLSNGDAVNAATLKIAALYNSDQ